ncbi:MAG: hypothetical protein MJ025_05100 [Victivallaceae bacterium]|nr:hypothetical protein [Victivallaceae bacterium]
MSGFRYVVWEAVKEPADPEVYAAEMKKTRDEVDEIMANCHDGVFRMWKSRRSDFGDDSTGAVEKLARPADELLPDDEKAPNAMMSYRIFVKHIVMTEPKVDVYEVYMEDLFFSSSTALLFPKYTFFKSMLRPDQVEFMERVLQLQSSK